MSLVHQKLYGTHTLIDVPTKEYVTQLIYLIEDTVSQQYMEFSKETHTIVCFIGFTVKSLRV